MQNKMRLLLMFILALLPMLFACNQNELSSEELMQYVMNPDHGLIKREERNGTVLEVYYKPSSLVVRQQNLDERDSSRKNHAESQLGKLDYFVLRLQRDGREIENGYAGDPNTFNDVINYLAYSISEDIKLIHGRDTIPVADIAYGRSFGAAKKTDLLVVFDSDLRNKDGSASVVLSDRLFGTGITQFSFDLSDLKNIPLLKPIH